MNPIPEVHTDGGEFRLDLVDDSAPFNEKRWRIVVKDRVLQIVLFDDASNEHRCLQIERQGTTPEVIRGGQPL